MGGNIHSNLMKANAEQSVNHSVAGLRSVSLFCRMKTQFKLFVYSLFCLFLSAVSLNAQQSGSVPNYLTVDQWFGFPPYVGDMNDVYRASDFYESPVVSVTNLTSYRSFLHASVVRLRGYVTAPESGYYHFWVTARNTAELWLSDNSSKSHKNLIASIDREQESSRVDIIANSSNLWDRFASQMSDEIYLEAGQVYYLEALHRNTDSGGQHIGIAWARPGADRESLPFAYLTSYDTLTDLDDQDDDSLPDSFEASSGLSLTDNGLYDLSGEGERGDYDSDGLTNREEYLLGTNPTLSDSDGDGMTDAEELNRYGLDPTVADLPSQSTLSSLNLQGYLPSATTAEWRMTSHGLLSSSYRGDLSYSFTIPGPAPARHYLINLQAALLGDLFLSDQMSVEALINGQSIGGAPLRFVQDAPSWWRWVTPKLSPGTHTLTLKIDNILGRRSLVVKQLEIALPTGPDLNSDGEPDWIIERLRAENQMLVANSLSRTSPGFVEGRSRMFPVVTSSLGENTSLEQATTVDTWFANIDLPASGGVWLSANFENSFVQSEQISWEETNPLDQEILRIRKGDSLKFQVVPSGGVTGQSSTVSIAANLAMLGVASQSTTSSGGVAGRAIDGNTSGKWSDGSITHTQNEVSCWWKVDLGAEYDLESVVLWNRTDGSLGRRLSNYQIQVLDAAGALVLSQSFHTGGTYVGAKESWSLPAGTVGQVVRIERLGPDFDNRNYLSFAEVEVFGTLKYTQPDTDVAIYQFNQAGTFQVSGNHTGGEAGTMTVEVKKADFPNDGPRNLLAVEASSSYRGVDFFVSDVDSDLFFDGGNKVSVVNEPIWINNKKFKIRALARGYGPTLMAARVEKNGPILNTYPLNLVRFADSLQSNFFASYTNYDQTDTLNINASMLIDGFPPGGYLRMRFIAGGTALRDGGSDIYFYESDLQDGVIRIPLKNDGALGVSFCYEFDIFEASGQRIGTR